MSSSVAESGGTTPVPASKSDGPWVLVPREPTEEMMLAGMVAPRSAATREARNTFDRHREITADIYRAMLAVAAKSESGEGH
jgi:hypothetical protein